MTGIIAVLIIVAIGLVSTVRIIDQGYVGVIQRLGKFHTVRKPGLTFIIPIIDRLIRVDVRETPRTGDQQDVITADNVGVKVNATIFSQVVDAQMALFNVSNYFVAIDQLARTTLRAVFGGMTLDQALSERKRINTELQNQMEAVADNWGLRINRIEIVDIEPPTEVMRAMALQKQADQEKRADILRSEGQQQSAVNVADGERQAAIKQAEGQRQASILRAEGERQAQMLQAEGRAQAIQAVYSAISAASPTPTMVSILQLDTLSKFADSPNSTIVVPYEAAGLMGAAQMLRGVLGAPPAPGGSNGTSAG